MVPSTPRPRLRAASLALIALSAVILVVALALPTVRFQRVGKAPEIYSIYGGVESLWEDGNRVSSTIVFLFSIVFPLGKLLFLARAAWKGEVSERGGTVLRTLIALGKWSMVDVFVIALFVGAILPGLLADASSLSGIYLFALGIILSMIAARLVARCVSPPDPSQERPDGRPARWSLLLSVAGLVLLGLGLAHGYYVVKESFLSKPNEIALLSMTRGLYGETERIVAACLAVFVVLATALRGLAATAQRLFRRSALSRATLWLDEWAMLDVFCLALWMVYDKLIELTTTTLLVGFWYLLAAALIGELDVWLVRRESYGVRLDAPDN